MTRQYVPFDELMDRPLSLNDSMQGQRKKGPPQHKNLLPHVKNRSGLNTRHARQTLHFDDEPAADIDSEEQHGPATRTRKARRASRLHDAKPAAHALSSAEHINVSCRFIIRKNSDIAPASIKINAPIPVNQVLRVVAPAQECPICLEPAEVPRMLGCGHVMCLPCMIKHRKYSPQASICPICGEVVSLSSSRTTPVTFLEADERFLPHEGSEVVLTLMFKPKDLSVALPVNVTPERAISDTHFPGPDMTLWSRVCEGSLEYAKQELAREVKVLIGARKKALEEFGNDEGYSEAAADIKQVIHNMQQETELPSKRKKQGGGDGKGGKKKPPGKPEGMYFYQAGFEGPTVFTLSQLDVSMLKAAYGSFASFPTSIITKIENVSYTSSDQSSDKRQKFLAHLPDQTPLAFMECDWTGIIPDHVLNKFQGKLDERRSKKVTKEVREEADRVKAQENIDMQFRSEIAEAMTPHDGIGFTTAAGLDMSLLPSLPSLSAGAPGSSGQQTTQQQQQPRGKSSLNPGWVDPRRDYDELMKHTYVPERGRKNTYLKW